MANFYMCLLVDKNVKLILLNNQENNFQMLAIPSRKLCLYDKEKIGAYWPIENIRYVIMHPINDHFL